MPCVFALPEKSAAPIHSVRTKPQARSISKNGSKSERWGGTEFPCKLRYLTLGSSKVKRDEVMKICAIRASAPHSVTRPTADSTKP